MAQKAAVLGSSLAAAKARIHGSKLAALSSAFLASTSFNSWM
jgi:hypothetical protein